MMDVAALAISSDSQCLNGEDHWRTLKDKATLRYDINRIPKQLKRID